MYVDYPISRSPCVFSSINFLGPSIDPLRAISVPKFLVQLKVLEGVYSSLQGEVERRDKITRVPALSERKFCWAILKTAKTMS